MRKKVYDVVLLSGRRPIVCWKFNSITAAVRYLAEVDFDIVDAECWRNDGKKLDVESLLEAWFNA